MTINDIKQKRDAITAILDEASEKLLHYWKKGRDELQIEEKEDKTFVSEADYAANKIITDGLSELFPQIPIVSEEAIHEVKSGGFWLIDPLDGTADFIHGRDDFAILVAYVNEQRAVQGGWVLFPALDLMFSAVDGELLTRGESKSLEVSADELLSDGSVYVRRGVADPEEQFSQVVNQDGLHSGAAWMRFFEGELSGLIMELGRLGTWDIAAPLAIAESLGALSKNKQGEPFLITKSQMPGEILVVSTPKMMPEVVKEADKIFG